MSRIIPNSANLIAPSIAPATLRIAKEVMRRAVVKIYNNVIEAEENDPSIISQRTKNLKEDCRDLRKDVVEYTGVIIPASFKVRLNELKTTATKLWINDK